MGVKALKLTCPLCKDPIEVDTNAHDEGDFIKCEECGELLEIEVRKGKYRLVTDQEKKYEEMEELDEELEYDDED